MAYRVLPFLSVFILFASNAASQNQSIVIGGEKPEQKADDDQTPRPPGVYNGVAPGTPNPPPIVVPAGAKPPQILWLGFQTLSGGRSRVFLQVTSKPDTHMEWRATQVVVTVKDAEIVCQNNKNSLETQFFNTPVDRAYLEKRGANIALVLTLRTEKVPLMTTSVDPTGYYFVYVDFPAGDYPVTKPLQKPAQATTTAETPAGEGRGSQQGAEANASFSGTGDDVSASTDAPIGMQPAKIRASAKAALTKDQMRAMDEEKPPILQKSARGSIKVGH